MSMLEQASLVYRNLQAASSSVARVLPKRPKLRLGTEYKAVNQHVKAKLWLRPNLVQVFSFFVGADSFAILDLFQEFLQVCADRHGGRRTF